jgi:hypothetical protein
MNTEYAGLPFDLAIGEVYGLRLWKTDQYGRLRARNWSRAEPWRPGVNSAKCLADAVSNAGIQDILDPTGAGRRAVDVMAEQDSYRSIVGPVGPPPQQYYRVRWDDGSTGVYADLKFKTSEPHEAPSENCSCGFYAYTDPKSHEIDGYYPASPYVLGVIKGTGRTLVGTRGFRCEKAEIIALLDPPDDPRRKQLLENVYRDVPLLPTEEALFNFAPIEKFLPDPTSEEFWSLP